MNARVVHTGEGPAFWVVGGRYTILTSGDETGGTYALIHAEVPPRGGPPPHVHRREDEAPPPDIPRLLAVAPRYGIEIVAADLPRPGPVAYA